MQTNKTPGCRPSKELVKRLVDLVAKKGKNSGLSWDDFEVGSLYIAVRWNGGWLAKRLRLWQHVSVSDRNIVPRLARDEHGEYQFYGEPYVLVEYDDFTRTYSPGDWEKTIEGIAL
jgi:hypothetical protein